VGLSTGIRWDFPSGMGGYFVRNTQDAFAQGLKYGAYLHYEMDLEPIRNYKPFQELLKPKG